MHRRQLLSRALAAAATLALPQCSAATPARAWIELRHSMGWGTYSRLRIMETGRIERETVEGFGDDRTTRRDRFRATPDHWAAAREALHAWIEGPHLAGHAPAVIEGPYQLPTDIGPPIVRYADGSGADPMVFVQQEARAGETVPDVHALFAALQTAIGVPLWPR
jgi:hypothetical protein